MLLSGDGSAAAARGEASGSEQSDWDEEAGGASCASSALSDWGDSDAGEACARPAAPSPADACAPLAGQPSQAPPAAAEAQVLYNCNLPSPVQNCCHSCPFELVPMACTNKQKRHFKPLNFFGN